MRPPRVVVVRRIGSDIPHIRQGLEDKGVGSLIRFTHNFMRKELLTRRSEVYRLTETDILQSRTLAERLVASHVFKTEHDLRDLRGDPEAIEIVADVAHYANLEISYVWAFTLWRIQAVFEGILTQSFLPVGTDVRGFTQKLRAVRRAGFELSADEEHELSRWADVRNRLSHRPEWYYHLTEVWKQDVDEYIGLIQRLLARWKGGGDFLPYAPEFMKRD